MHSTACDRPRRTDLGIAECASERDRPPVGARDFDAEWDLEPTRQGRSDTLLWPCVRASVPDSPDFAGRSATASDPPGGRPLTLGLERVQSTRPRPPGGFIDHESSPELRRLASPIRRVASDPPGRGRSSSLWDHDRGVVVHVGQDGLGLQFAHPVVPVEPVVQPGADVGEDLPLEEGGRSGVLRAVEHRPVDLGA